MLSRLVKVLSGVLWINPSISMTGFIMTSKHIMIVRFVHNRLCRKCLLAIASHLLLDVQEPFIN